MNKLAKELIKENSFEFLSKYQKINIREDKKSYQEIIVTTKNLISTSLEQAKENLENGNYKGSNVQRKLLFFTIK